MRLSSLFSERLPALSNSGIRLNFFCNERLVLCNTPVKSWPFPLSFPQSLKNGEVRRQFNDPRSRLGKGVTASVISKLFFSGNEFILESIFDGLIIFFPPGTPPQHTTHNFHLRTEYFDVSASGKEVFFFSPFLTMTLDQV